MREGGSLLYQPDTMSGQWPAGSRYWAVLMGISGTVMSLVFQILYYTQWYFRYCTILYGISGTVIYSLVLVFQALSCTLCYFRYLTVLIGFSVNIL